MKKELSLSLLRKIFNGAVAVILLSLVGFGAYLVLTLNDLLIGQVQLKAAPSILTRLQTDVFERAKKRLEIRRTLPYPPDDVRNPFFGQK